jgi:divalent metal cation (Fe/Co/Zn/Cd) transporter
MDLVQTKKLTRYLSCIVVALIFADLITIVTTPYWLKIAYENGYDALEIFFGTIYNTAHPSGNYYFMAAFIMLCGVVIMGILYDAYKILKQIQKSMPFCIQNAKSFQNAGFCAFFLTVAFILKMFFSPSILTLVCVGVFILFGLFMIVLAQLFKLATQIKDENELTI